MIAVSAAAIGSIGALSSCNSWIDYAGQTKITDYIDISDEGNLLYLTQDENGEDLWVETENSFETSNFLDIGFGPVTVSQYIDGDTTYFKEPDNRTVRTRYSNINTPESTAQVQKWGKSASIYVQDKLENSTAVILSNPTMDLRAPSTDSNNRYLCLVWYATVENPTLDDYRCLNLDIVQEGYSAVTGMEDTYPYYQTFIDAQTQAQNHRLHIHSPSSTVDPNYYTGEATDMTVLEFNQKASEYVGAKVHITSAIVSHYLGTSSVWVESLVEEGTEYENADGELVTLEEDTVFGIYLFAGYSGSITPLYVVGNELSFTGVVTEYNGEYQLTDLSWNRFTPSEDDVQVISTENTVPSADRTMTAAEALTPGRVNTATFVNVSDVLTCYGGYGGSSEIDSSTGSLNDNNAMTLFVEAEDGTTCRVYLPDGCNFRTDNNRRVTTYSWFVGRSFTIRGLVEEYQGYYNFEVPGETLLTFVDEDDDEETDTGEETGGAEDEETTEENAD